MKFLANVQNCKQIMSKLHASFKYLQVILHAKLHAVASKLHANCKHWMTQAYSSQDKLQANFMQSASTECPRLNLYRINCKQRQAIASKLQAIASELLAIASKLQAIASKLQAIASKFQVNCK